MPNPVINAPQSFIVGSTVHCELRIARRPLEAPYSPPTVTLNQMVLLPSTIIIPSGVVVTNIATGFWTFDIPTTNLNPGTYKVTFLCYAGPAAATLTSTAFIVTAL